MAHFELHFKRPNFSNFEIWKLHFAFQTGTSSLEGSMQTKQTVTVGQSASLPNPLDCAADGLTLPLVSTSGQLDTVGKA
jgi:hypothetical protein